MEIPFDLVSSKHFVVSLQEGGHSIDPLQKLYTLEAVLALLLRISHHYGKSGAQVLFTMGAMEHISSCKAINLQLKVFLYLYSHAT